MIRREAHRNVIHPGASPACPRPPGRLPIKVLFSD